MSTRDGELDLISEAFGYIGDDIIEQSDIESLERYYSTYKKGRVKTAFKVFVKHSSRIAAGFAATFVGFAVLLVVLMNVMFGGFGCNSSKDLFEESDNKSADGDIWLFYPENDSYSESFPSSHPDDTNVVDGIRLPWEDDIYATLTNVGDAEDPKTDNVLYLSIGFKGDYLGSGDVYIKVNSDGLKIEASEDIDDGLIIIEDLYASDQREKKIEFTFGKTSDAAEDGVISFEICYRFDDPDDFAERLKSYEYYDILDIDKIFANGVLFITKFNIEISRLLN